VPAAGIFGWGATAQGAWDRVPGHEVSQKLKQFADIAYRF